MTSDLLSQMQDASKTKLKAAIPITTKCENYGTSPFLQLHVTITATMLHTLIYIFVLCASVSQNRPGALTRNYVRFTRLTNERKFFRRHHVEHENACRRHFCLMYFGYLRVYKNAETVMACSYIR